MEQVKVGVIGAGVMGQRHCRVYSSLRRAELVGICDSRFEVGYLIAQQYEVPFYEHIDDLLAHVDAVSVVTPTPFHFEIAMHCLARGIHVIIEKPITETVEQAEWLTQAAEDRNLVVQVGHIERFNPTYSELKNVLEEMTPLAINLRRLSPYQGSNTDVDVIFDLMIHDLDLVLNLIQQEPISINAYGLTALSGKIDHAVAHLGFQSGPLVTVTASRVTEQKVRSIEVTAMEAYVEGDLLNKSVLVHRRTVGEYYSSNKYRQESVVQRIHVPGFEPLFLELQHFIDCIVEGTTPRIPARHGLNALRLASEIQRVISARLIDAGPSSQPKLA
ncbi:MAG: Gfo/Idh/MocA family oxidoreductase [Anaerolineales bacterium]|nr:Gfo/Idh/MocA family oxidoreductase [Anaerolineales bacterium]